MSKFAGNNRISKELAGMATPSSIKEVKNLPKADTVNRSGVPAFSLSDEIHLLQMLNTLKLENQFYRSEGQQMREIQALIEKIATKDPYLVAQMIVWSRCKGEGMRSVNHLAAALLAPFISGQEWGKRFYSSWNKKLQQGGCVFRVDDMSEILAIFSALNQTKLTNAMKKGFAHVLETADEYQLLKYKKPVFDVMNLCHPNSAESLAESILENGEKVKTLDALKQGFPVVAKTWEAVQSEAGQIVAEAVRAGKISATEAKVKLEQAKEGNWKQLLDEGGLGILAALRNIRNVVKVANDRSTIEKLCALLSDGDKIRKGMIMPYQIDTAYQIVVDELRQYAAAPAIMQALLKGYEESVPNLATALPGKTCILLDCSGSMHSSCYNKDGKRINATAVEKAGLIAATIAKSCDCDIVRFGGHAEFATYDKRKNVFALGQELATRNMGSTSISSAFKLITQQKKQYDRIIILSDYECNDYFKGGCTQYAYAEYIKYVCSPYIYCIDFASYGTVPVANNGKVNVYLGYGYTMFNDIASKEFNPAAHLEEVRKIVI